MHGTCVRLEKHLGNPCRGAKIAIDLKGRMRIEHVFIEAAAREAGFAEIDRREQISYDHQGMIIRDVIALASEIPPPRMKPLLAEIIRGGQLITPLPNLDVIRNVARDELYSLPDKYRRIRGSVNPPVRFSNLLNRLTKSLWSNAK